MIRPPQFAPGDKPTIPGLELCEVVGQGAFSVVYRCIRNEEELAIKVQRAASETDESRQRVWREAATLARLRHPHLCTVRCVGEVGNRLYIAMTFIEGPTLAERISREPFAEAEAASLLSQIASALAVVHAAGVIHGDIKPGNVLLDAEGHPYLIDFGLATRGRDALDADGAFGTLKYASPEQIGILKRTVDARSDLYSLGIMAYEMVIGRVPFITHDAAELARQHATIVPTSLCALVPSISRAFSDVVDRLVAKDPDDRFQSANELDETLRSLLQTSSTREEVKPGAAKIKAAPSEAARHEEATIPSTRAHLEQLTDRLDDACRGHGRIVLISGVSGVGKSYLGEAACLRFKRLGKRVLSSRATADDPMPFSSLVQLLNDLVEQLTRDSSRDRAWLRKAAGPGALFLQRLCPSISSLLDDVPLPAPSSATADSINQAAVDLFTGIARSDRGLVLFIDNAQWLDDATRKVLLLLSQVIDTSHVLVLTTARTGSDEPSTFKPFIDAIHGPHLEELPMSALDAEDVRSLIGTFLGSPDIAHDDPLVERLALRSRGNPMELFQYLHLLVDGGHLRFIWDRWVLDEAGLNSLAISLPVLDLALERTGRLPRRHRAVLVLGGLLGARFDHKALRVLGDAGLLSAVERSMLDDLPRKRTTSDLQSPRPPEAPQDADAQIDEALRQAKAYQIVEAHRGEAYTFLHDTVRDALLSQIDLRDRPALHRAVATALDKLDENAFALKEETVYALARHYRAGSSAETAPRAFEVHWAAGRAAAQKSAFQDASAFYTQALTIAKDHEVDTCAEFLHDLAIVNAVLWRKTEARSYLRQAIATSSDPLLRARCYLALARLLLRECDEIIDLMRLALGELGVRHPDGTPLSVLWNTASWIVGFFKVRWFRHRTANPRDVERAELVVDCLLTIGLAEFYRMRPLAIFQSAMMPPADVALLGRSAVHVRRLALTAAMCGTFGLRRTADRRRNRSLQIAEEIGDPGVLGLAWIYVGYSQDYGGHPLSAGETFRTILENYASWLSLQDLLAVATAQTQLLLFKGLAKEILDLSSAFTKELQRRNVPLDQLDPYSDLKWMTHHSTLLLRRNNSDTTFAKLAKERSTRYARGYRAFILGHAALVTLRSGRYDDDFESLCAEYDSLRIPPTSQPGVEHQPLAEAWIRLHQIEDWTRSSAKEEASTNKLAYAWQRYRIARRRLKRVVRVHPTILAHLRALDAKQALLKRKWRRAEDLCVLAEEAATTYASPWPHFETMLIRASIFRAYGWEDAVTRELRRASLLAVKHSWTDYLARVKTMVRDEQASEIWSRSTSRSLVKSRSAPQDIEDTRSLSALLEVSLASTNVLDPERQAHIMLDAIISVLGCDRALLFLGNVRHDAQSEPHRLGPIALVAGRNAQRESLTRDAFCLDANAARAFDERTAVSIAGAALEAPGQDPRFIDVLAVPLAFRNEPVGAIYIDRPTTNVGFTDQDASVLTAIGHHVAIALETSRISRLAAAVEVERAQRQLAEHLSSVVSAIVSSLDLRSVLEAILHHLTDLVPYRRASILLVADDALQVAAQRGFLNDEIDFRTKWPLRTVERVTILTDDYPYPHRVDPLSDPPSTSAPLLLVPLLARAEMQGVLCLETDAVATTEDHSAKLAETVGAHATAAIENARLFETLRQQATKDSLTGLCTRRHFLALGERELSIARGQIRALAALMIDVDHFKRVNDTYGHGVGDQVLVEVARRLAGGVRESDIVGRLGGEEFCVLFIDTSHEQGLLVANRLRNAIADTPIATDAGPLTVTLSGGLAPMRDESESVELHVLLARADAALYEAKRTGRNRILMAEPATSPQ
ncbi:MAG: diguanylate cyclase [Deltaproteobacteria bacterium]|nr:diguanylate cyclase [Deltaproteobacteria bacterium]